MKKIYKSLFLLALSGVVLTSCDEDGGNTGESLIDYNNIGATISTASQSITVSEKEVYSNGGEVHIPFTVTLAAPSTADAVIDLTQTGGSADADDFHVSSLVIPAGSTTGTGSIDLYSNGYIEDVETIELTASTRGNFNLNDFTMDITINDDYINDNIDFTLAWDGTYTAEGTGATLELDYCAIDFDIFIYDSEFTDLGIYDGATGNCPEHVTLSGLPDGTYYIAVDLYANPLSDFGATVSVPLTLSWSQEYFEDQAGSITFEGYTMADTSGTFGVAQVTIENGHIFTVTPFE